MLVLRRKKNVGVSKGRPKKSKQMATNQAMVDKKSVSSHSRIRKSSRIIKTENFANT